MGQTEMRARAQRASVFLSMLVVASLRAPAALALGEPEPPKNSAAEPQPATPPVPPAATPPAPGPAHDRDVARGLFENGVTLARDGRYADAKSAFLRAYDAYPHYLVLYNVAQADIQLGNLRSAREYLERFLREGAGSLSSERQQEARDEVDGLSRRLAAEQASPGASASADAPAELGSGARALGATQTPPPSPGTGSTPAASTRKEHSETALGSATATASPSAPPLDARPGSVRDESWGLVLGGSGALLLGVASGLYIWNDGRHSEWSRERAELDALPDREQALGRDRVLWQRAKGNNDLLASIERVDVVTLLTAGIGALALGAGAWELLAPRASSHAAFVASGSTLSWRKTW